MRKLISVFLVFLLSLTFVSAATLSGSTYDFSLEKLNKVIVKVNGETYISQDGDYSFELKQGKYTIIAAHADDSGEIVKIAQQSIEIIEDKQYNLDLILMDTFSEENELMTNIDNLNVDTGLTDTETSLMWLWVGLFIVVVFGVFMFYRIKKDARRESDRLKEESKIEMEKAKEESKKEVEKVKEETKKEVIKAKEETQKEVEKVKEETKQEVSKIKLAKDIDSNLKELVDFIVSEGGRTTQKDIRKKFPSSEAKISLMITELESKGIIKKIKKGRGNVVVLTQNL